MVSAIVPVYNGAPWLASTIDSALAQTFEDLEIIVVNDGSTDDSLAVATRCLARAGGRLRIIDQANAGVSAARNAALQVARGCYFALLDADDCWLPDHLATAMTAFDRDPDLGLVHANIEFIDTHGNSTGVARRCWSRQADAYEAIALRHEHVSCPTAVFSRAALETVGAFDSTFTGFGCEDRDLWLRIAERFRIHYLDRVSARYRVHPEGMSRQVDPMAMARAMLVAKVACSERGRGLVARMQAMIESDLGLTCLDEGRAGQALRHHWRALRLDPSERIIRRRILGALVAIVRKMPRRLLTLTEQEAAR